MQFDKFLRLSIIFFIFAEVFAAPTDDSDDENPSSPKQGWFSKFTGRSPKSNQPSNADENESFLNTDFVSTALNYAKDMGGQWLAPLEPAVSKYGEIIAKSIEPLTKLDENPKEVSKIRQHLNYLIKATNPIPLIQQLLAFIRDLFSSQTVKLVMKFLEMERKVLGTIRALVSPVKYAGQVVGQGLKSGTELAESALNAPLNLVEQAAAPIPGVNSVVSGTTGIARHGVRGVKNTAQGVTDGLFNIGGKSLLF